jgi:hypothetical protein
MCSMQRFGKPQMNLTRRCKSTSAMSWGNLWGASNNAPNCGFERCPRTQAQVRTRRAESSAGLAVNGRESLLIGGPRDWPRSKFRRLRRNLRAARGKHLQLQFTVEDEGVFTMPWSATVTYRRGAEPWREVVCAENTRELAMAGRAAAVPTANQPDF